MELDHAVEGTEYGTPEVDSMFSTTFKYSSTQRDLLAFLAWLHPKRVNLCAPNLVHLLAALLRLGSQEARYVQTDLGQCHMTARRAGNIKAQIVASQRTPGIGTLVDSNVSFRSPMGAAIPGE